MNTLVLLAAIAIVGYVLTACAYCNGVPRSISALGLKMPRWGQTLWTVCMAATAFLLMPAIIDRTPDEWRFLAFLTCAGVIVLAVCPLIGRKETDTVHIFAAFATAAASQLLVMACNPWLLLLWLPWLAAYIWKTKDERPANTAWPTTVFWAEISAIAITLIYPVV